MRPEDFVPNSELTYSEWPNFDLNHGPDYTMEYFEHFHMYTSIYNKVIRSERYNISVLLYNKPIYRGKSIFQDNSEVYKKELDKYEKTLKKYICEIHAPLVEECKAMQQKLENTLTKSLEKEEIYFQERDNDKLEPEQEPSSEMIEYLHVPITKNYFVSEECFNRQETRRQRNLKYWTSRGKHLQVE